STGRFTMAVVLVTIPRLPASRMPRLTPRVRPKSSALTMSVRAVLTPARPAPVPSRLAHHPAEVEPERLHQLGARAGAGLGVLELVEVQGQRHPFLLDAVELRGEPAPLVRLREDELGAGEGLVVAGDLLHGVGEQALDGLLVRAGHRGKRGG